MPTGSTSNNPQKRPSTKVTQQQKLENSVQEIKDALLGDFEKKGLLPRFAQFEKEVRQDVESINRTVARIEENQKSFATQVELQKMMEPVTPVVKTVNNWKFLIGVIVTMSSFIASLITWAVTTTR